MVTQKQIAKHLGVSRQLVGFALNGGGTVSEKTRRQVLDAAKTLGYHRNEIARAMVTGRNPVLGFLSELPEMETAGRLLTGALDAAAERGYTLKLLRHSRRGDEAEVVRRCIEMQLAGVLTVHIMGEPLDFLVKALDRHGIPVAVLDQDHETPPTEEIPVIHVLSDDAQGCRAAVTHLYALGHRKIGFVSALPGPSVVAAREAAFQQTIATLGLPLPEGFLVRGDWGRRPLTEPAAHALLDHEAGPPTAVCCIDDQTALTTMRVFRKRGLSVPDDISVVGYADLTMAEFADPPLTTVAQPFVAMGRTAARLLIDRIDRRQKRVMGEGKGDETVSEEASLEADAVLPTEIIVRESTAPPPTHPVRPAPHEPCEPGAPGEPG